MNPLFNDEKATPKDLFLFLVETMHNELNTAPKIKPLKPSLNEYNYENSFKLFFNYYKSNYKSIFSDLFYGMYNQMIKCLNCNFIKHNINCYNVLTFPLEEVRKYKNRIQNVVNIIECFEYYNNEVYMTGDNQIYCTNCHRMVNNIFFSKLIIGSNVLVINLNRGKGFQFNVKLTFPEYLDIKNFLYYKESPHFYELIGIVVYIGKYGYGTFMAFCKSIEDQKWYKYNDITIHKSSFEEACITGVPYLLFYSSIKK